MPILDTPERPSLYFEDRGDGPPVLLLHSFLCSGDMWRHQVEPLARRHRVINLDLRGHGRSGFATGAFTLYDMVDDALAVLDHLGIERAAWAGLSIGGMIALRAALTAPGRVSSLLLFDTDGGAEKPFPKLKYRVLAFGASLVGIRPFVPAVLPLMFGRTTRREHPDLPREWARRFRDAHMPSVRRGVEAIVRRESMLDRLGDVPHPALVVVGAEDETLPPSRARRLAEGLPDARLREIPQAGHLSALERPRLVTDLMLGFLKQHLGERS